MPVVLKAAQAAIVNAVNPRLNSYTNATFIAICVLIANIGAVFGMAALLNTRCSEVATVERSTPVVLGEHLSHLSFIRDTSGLISDPPRGPGVTVMTQSDDKLTTTTRRTEICILSTKAMFTRPLGKPFHSEEGRQFSVDNGVEYKNCVAEWMQCHPYPYDSGAAISRRNQPCLGAHQCSAAECSPAPTRIPFIPGEWPAVGWCGDLASAEQLRHEYQTCFLGVKKIDGIQARNDEGQIDHGCKDDDDDPSTDIDVFTAPYHTHLDVGPADPAGAPWYTNLCGRRPHSTSALQWGSVPPDLSLSDAFVASVPYEVKYNISDHTAVETCQGFLVSFTIAFGFAAQIELVATLVFLAVFSVLGVTKRKDPVSGLVSTAVGASAESNHQAMVELQERLKQLEEKNNVQKDAKLAA